MFSNSNNGSNGLFGNQSTGAQNQGSGTSGGLFSSGNTNNNTQKPGGLFSSGPANTNQQQQSNNPIQYVQNEQQKEAEKIKKYREVRNQYASERTIFDRAKVNASEFLNLFRIDSNREEFKNSFNQILNMEETKQKYSKLNGYFAPYKEEQDLKAKLKEHGIEGGFFGKFKLSPETEITIKKIAEDINLNVYHTFRLLEEFFYENIEQLYNINNSNKNSPSILNQITTEIYLRYNKERGSVFKTLNVIMRFALKRDNMSPSQEFASNFIHELVEKRSLQKNLWDSYKNLRTQKASNTAKTKKGIYADQVLSEQLWIVRNLYFGFANEIFTCDGEMYLEMLSLFLEDDFVGFFKNCEETNLKDYNDLKNKSIQLFNISGLVLISALNAQVVLESNFSELLNTNKAPLAIFKGDSLGKILDLIIKCIESPNNTTIENGHVFKFIVMVLDFLKDSLYHLKNDTKFEKQTQNAIITGVQNQLTNRLSEIHELIDRINEESLIVNFMRSSFYNHDMLENSLINSKMLKQMVALKYMNIARNENITQVLSEQSIDYVGSVITECLTCSKDEVHQYLLEERHVFRQFESQLFQSFPEYDYHLTNIQIALAKNSSLNFIGTVLDDFKNINQYTLPVGYDVQKQKSYGIDTAYDYISTEEVILDNGVVIPKGSPLVFFEESNQLLVQNLQVNFWHVIWKQWQSLVIEASQKGATISKSLRGYIKLVSIVIQKNPNITPLLQSLMFDEKYFEDQRNQDSQQSIGVILLLILDTISLLCQSPNQADITLELVKALNSLLLSSLNRQTIVAIQIYQNIPRFALRTNIHPLIQTLELFETISRHPTPELLIENGLLIPTNIAIEIASMVINILNMSDFMFDLMPNESYFVNALGHNIRNTSMLVEEFYMKWTYYNDQEMISTNMAKELNENFLQIIEKNVEARRGYMLNFTSFIPDALEYLVREFLAKFESHLLDAYPQCSECKYTLAQKLMVILNNLLLRFRVSKGKELNIEVNKLGSYEATRIAKFFNSLNINAFLLKAFDIASNHRVFVGDEKLNAPGNELGIENRLVNEDVAFQSGNHRVQQALQGFLVEALATYQILIELVDQSTQHLQKNQFLSELNILSEIKSQIFHPENMYSYKLSTDSKTYNINFFIALVMLCNFNKEHLIQEINLTNPDKKYLDRIDFKNTMLFSKNVDIFEFGIYVNHPTLFSSGIFLPSSRSNSVSEAVMDLLKKIVSVWGQSRLRNRLQLSGLLVSSNLPSGFCLKIESYIFNCVIDQIEGYMTSPGQACAAFEFLNECQKTQKDFFRQFIKFCDENARFSRSQSKLNRFADIMMQVIEYFQNEKFLGMVISSSVKMRIVVSITDLIITILMDEKDFYQIKDQIRKFGLENLIGLIKSIVENRIDPLERVSRFATELLFFEDEGYNEIEDNYSINSVDFLRLRDLTESELRLCSVIKKLLKFSKMEFFSLLRNKKPKIAGQHEKMGIFGHNLVTLLNQFVGEELVSVFEILDTIKSTHLNGYLRENSNQGSMIVEGEFKDTIEFIDSKSVEDFSSINDVSGVVQQKSGRALSDGIEFDPFKVLKQFKEIKVSPVVCHTVLYNIVTYNCLNQLRHSRSELIRECTSSLNIYSSLGTNGILLSTIQTQDPLANIARFVTSLENQREMKSGLFRGLIDKYDFFASVKPSYDEINFNSNLLHIFNPFSSVGNEIRANLEPWSVLKLLGVKGDSIDEEKINQALVILESNLSKCKQSLSVVLNICSKISDKESQEKSYPFELILILCKVSQSYLQILGYLITNFYYRGQKSTLEQQEYDQFANEENVKGFIPCVQKAIEIYSILSGTSRYVYDQHEKLQKSIEPIVRVLHLCLSNMNHFQGLVSDLTKNSATQMICNFLTNIILKPNQTGTSFSATWDQQFGSDEILTSNIGQQKKLTREELYEKEREKIFILCLNSYGLVLDLHPYALTANHINRLLVKFQSCDISTKEYTAICQFLIACYNCNTRREKIEQSKILDCLLNLKQFKNAGFSSQNFYSGSSRDFKQIAWCWTLQLILVVMNNIEQSYIRFKFMVSLMSKYQGRFLSILGYKFTTITVSKDGEREELGPDFEAMNYQNKNAGFKDATDNQMSLNFRTYGYLEELQLTLTLISLIFKNSVEIKKINSRLFEMYFYVLTNRTIKLLNSSNQRITQFKAISWIETELEKVRLKTEQSEKGLGTQSKQFTTMKKQNDRKSSQISDIGNRSLKSRAGGDYMIGVGRTYNPTLFHFQIEYQFILINFLIFDSIVYALEASDFFNYFEDEAAGFFSCKLPTLNN